MKCICKNQNRIVFLEGLPGVGKTTIVNTIKQRWDRSVHTVDEIVVDLQKKTKLNEDIYIINDNKKINMYNSGIVVIDRGPISTLSYSQTREMIDESYFPLNIKKWFDSIKELYNQENVKVIFLTAKGKKYFLPLEDNSDPYGSIQNQKLLEKITINNCKKYVKNLKIIEYYQENMEDIIYEIINPHIMELDGMGSSKGVLKRIKEKNCL